MNICFVIQSDNKNRSIGSVVVNDNQNRSIGSAVVNDIRNRSIGSAVVNDNRNRSVGSVVFNDDRNRSVGSADVNDPITDASISIVTVLAVPDLNLTGIKIHHRPQSFIIIQQSSRLKRYIKYMPSIHHTIVNLASMHLEFHFLEINGNRLLVLDED